MPEAHQASALSRQILRDAIPDYCFERSYLTPFYYLLRHLTALMLLALCIIKVCEMTASGFMLSLMMAVILHMLSFCAGLLFTGMWILAHECGHSAFSPNNIINNVVGWLLHSFLLVPYHSWAITHRRHHSFAGHMDKDTAHVPRRAEERTNQVFFEASKDAPLFVFIRLGFHQLFGWPLYLVFNASAGLESVPQRYSAYLLSDSHLNPYGRLFYKTQQKLVWISNVGLLGTVLMLRVVSSLWGSKGLFYLYIVPYIWTNFWIVAITFLHHTHPDVPHFEKDSWDFIKGATSTVDRDLGFIDEYFFFHICKTHVVHHLFSRIPFWHAEAATDAIKPLLGPYYRSDSTPFLQSLWTTFRDCDVVHLSIDPASLTRVRVWTKRSAVIGKKKSVA